MERYEELSQEIRQFCIQRDWDQFHSPNNLAKSIMLEAAELLECFQFDAEQFDLAAVKEELADVFTYCIQMSQVLNVDLITITHEKMKKNAEKYPIEKAKGKAIKYDKL